MVVPEHEGLADGGVVCVCVCGRVDGGKGSANAAAKGA